MGLRSLKPIGFWRSPDEPDLPDPKESITYTWPASEREQIVDYLEHGRELACYRGFSRCRICDKPNGSADLTDGVWVWPEGFAHYLKEHNVKPPSEFIIHVILEQRKDK